MPHLSLLWRKHRHIAPPGTLGVATSSYSSGKCGVKGAQATNRALFFDSFTFLSTGDSNWDYKLVGWTGEFEIAATNNNEGTSMIAVPLNKASAPIPISSHQRAPVPQDSAALKYPEINRRRLEKQLEHDHGGRVVGQNQRFGAPDAYASIFAVVLWGSKALYADLSGSQNTRPGLARLPAGTPNPAVRRPTKVTHHLESHSKYRTRPPLLVGRHRCHLRLAHLTRRTPSHFIPPPKISQHPDSRPPDFRPPRHADPAP